MKRLLLLLLLSTPLAAQESDLRELLRDALYTEEVDRDPVAAATGYEELLARFRDQRALAATALFRLAEVRRKQDRKEEAITLYQRLLAEFPEAGAEGKLARENLAALGGEPPAPGEPVNDEESLDLTRLTKLAQTSPDLLKDPKLLCNAARQNRLRVMRFLIERGADPNSVIYHKSTGKPEDSPLLRAAVEGHLSACKLLLEAGSDPNLDLSQFQERPLLEAAIRGHGLVVALLLEHGADPDFLANGGSLKFVVGTALAQALRCGHPGIAALLVEAGAEVNPPTEPFIQTALHVAAGQGDAGSVKLLLDAGADPQATITRPDHWDMGTNPEIKTGTTPLLLAVEARSADCIRLLAAAAKTAAKTGAHGAALRRAVELNSLDLVKLLLDSGTDPNALDFRGHPALAAALDPDHADIFQLLLERGADPNSTFGLLSFDPGPGCDDPFAETSDQRVKVPNFLLYEASCSGDRLPALKSLLAAGARPNPVAIANMVRMVAEWDEDGSVVAKLLESRPDHFNPAEIPPMSDWQPAARRVFLQQVVYPALAARPEISFLFLHSGIARPFARQSDSPEAPALARLLLDHFDFVVSPGANTGDRRIAWSDLQLVRADASGTWTGKSVDLVGETPFPDLRWGDIITAEPNFAEKGEPGYLDSETASLRFDWALQKRISFPVTVEIDGTAREVTVNSGRLVFDPTRDEVPWAEAMELAWLLSNDCPSELIVRRSGWEDIQITVTSTSSNAPPQGRPRVPLQAGDRIVFRTKEYERQKRVLLTVPGYPFARHFGEKQVIVKDGVGTSSTVPVTYPTLAQAIAHAYAPWIDDSAPKPEAPDQIPTDLILARLAAGRDQLESGIPVIPPHPDFGHIRIRRVAEDNAESVLEIDLAAAIAACTEDTPDTEARAADIPLQPGDIVELPLHRDRLDQPWTGFSPAEVRWFRKALGGRIQVVQPSSQIQQLDLSWHPPLWFDSPAGLLAYQPAGGPATMTARRILDKSSGEIEILRDTERSPAIKTDQAFLRNRDKVFIKNTSSPGPGSRVRRVPTSTRLPTSPPRIRRVPTPPAR